MTALNRDDLQVVFGNWVVRSFKKLLSSFSVRFVVHGVKVLVAVPNSVMGNHIESDARGVMQVEGECKFSEI